jgi:hypothetical protein
MVVRVLHGHLAFDSRVLRPATFFLFQSRGDLMAFAPAKGGGVPFEEIESGVSSFTRALPWGVVHASSYSGSMEDTRQAVLEGAVQWLLTARAHRLPLALDLGVVKAFGTFYIEHGQGYVGRPPRGYTSFVARAADRFHSTNAPFVPIERLLAETSLSDAVARHGFQMFYAESWAFAHFLIFSREMAGTQAFDRLADAFGRGLSPQEALQQGFGSGAKDINSKFLTYLRGGDFFEEQVPAGDTGLSVADVPPAAASAGLVRLALAEGHPDFALAYAEGAVSLAPEAGSYDALALVDSEARRDKEALAACQAAIRLGTRDGWTWNICARSRASLAQGAPLSPSDARVLLNLEENAVTYRHDLRSAFDSISDLIGTAGEVTGDDGKFIVFGRRLYPADGWLEVGQAEWARRTGDSGLAHRLLDDALAHPENLTASQADRARRMREVLAHAAG